MAQIIDLTASQELPADCYIYKHSTRCPISASVARTLRKFETDLPIYWINCLESPAISDWVAHKYHVEHETPQLIKVQEGKVVNTLAHYFISDRNLQKA